MECKEEGNSSFVGMCEKMLKNKCAYFIHNVYFFNTLEGFVCVQGGGAGLIMTAAAISLFVCFFYFLFFNFYFFYFSVTEWLC